MAFKLEKFFAIQVGSILSNKLHYQFDSSWRPTRPYGDYKQYVAFAQYWAGSTMAITKTSQYCRAPPSQIQTLREEDT